jgi:hypothetical protein
LILNKTARVYPDRLLQKYKSQRRGNAATLAKNRPNGSVAFDKKLSNTPWIALPSRVT